VIQTRDVTLKDDLLYDPLDLDIGAILGEHVDKLIKILELPEMEDIEASVDNNLLETLVVEVPASLESSSINTPNTESTNAILEKP
jgi:hypothetical protein